MVSKIFAAVLLCDLSFSVWGKRAERELKEIK
jgi:hypothetical protein